MCVNKFDNEYWTERWKRGETGWDIGSISTPIKDYIDQLENRNLKILVPGAGAGYEVAYLHQQGFVNVFMVDISPYPLQQFRERNPDFPAANLICQDFFELIGEYDLIIEQTFFSALPPDLRARYVVKMHELLANKGGLVGLLWGVPMNLDSPPYGGSVEEYERLFQDYFELRTMAMAYNSIPPRSGRELFINFRKNTD